MRSAITVAVLCIVCSVPQHFALAVCNGTPVRAFGAKGDGSTDDTSAIQSAIDAAAAGGGGSVVFNVGRYFTAGTLNVPAGVVLCGATEGPFDSGSGVNPGETTIAATLLVTNTAAPFITLNGVGAGVTDLIFHYPNQVHASASSPKVYPFTIVAKSSGTKVLRSFATNAYNFLDIESGKVIAQDLNIGAYNIGIKVDHANDRVAIGNVINSIFWDSWEGDHVNTIDSWVKDHSTALLVNRVDSLEVHNFNLFIRNTGLLITDSTDAAQNPRCGYGSGSDINLDTVQYGIIVDCSNTAGFVFTNLVVGSGNGGEAAVQVRGTGSLPPEVLVESGSIRGSWSLGPFPTPAAGHITVANIIGYDLP